MTVVSKGLNSLLYVSKGYGQAVVVYGHTLYVTSFGAGGTLNASTGAGGVLDLSTAGGGLLDGSTGGGGEA